MKSIAILGSSIIEAQSMLNTAHSTASDVFWGGTAISGLASFLLQSWYSLLFTSGFLKLMWRHVTNKVIISYKKQIKKQFEIVKCLLASELLDISYVSHDNESAYSLVKKIKNLLLSSHLSPPFSPREPESIYISYLDTIEEKVKQEGQRKINKKSEKIEYYHTQNKFEISQKLPIVYDKGYNITFGGIENLHPFDTKKYGKVAHYLKQHLGIEKLNFYKPPVFDENDMKLVHTPKYIESLSSPLTLALLVDLPIVALFPKSIRESKFIAPVKKATSGTVLALELALKYGWSINLSGGYHHAKSNVPVYGGYCLINDICIAAKKKEQELLQKNQNYKIMIVDLDAHQGNGHEDIAENNSHFVIFDMFNGDTWPGDFSCQERINFRYPLRAKTQDKEYLAILKTNLPDAINQAKPDVIIYNAGTDVYEKDPIGELSISAGGIIERDAFVFHEAISRKIPIVMVLSGGYHKDSAEIIGRSIENIYRKIINH